MSASTSRKVHLAYHEYFAVVFVKKNIGASNVGEEPFVPWRHWFLCEGREEGSGRAPPIRSLGDKLDPTPILILY